MCSIVGSFDKNEIIELVALNRHRGEHSHSISLYDVEQLTIISTIRKMGPLDPEDIFIPQGCYCIVHQQAPTTDNKSLDNIHPAEKQGELLWHNGILKAKEVKRLQKKHNTKESWDTMLLLQDLIQEGYPKEIDGSFSCLFCDGVDVFLFRNAIAPMFVNAKLDISSTKPKQNVDLWWEELPSQLMYWMDFEDRKIKKTEKKFITVDLPYIL